MPLTQPEPTIHASRLQIIFSQARVSLITPKQQYLVFCRVTHTLQHKPIKIICTTI